MAAVIDPALSVSLTIAIVGAGSFLLGWIAGFAAGIAVKQKPDTG